MFMIKKVLTIIMTVAAMTSLFAGSVTLGWTPYVGDPNVNAIKIYAVPGSNTVFTAGNANATLIVSTPVANSSLTVSNLASGPWTFVATAVNTFSQESVNSNTATTNTPVPVVTLFKILSVTVP